MLMFMFDMQEICKHVTENLIIDIGHKQVHICK